ncbi:MAG: B12-binding domain-containing radical SAM protein [Deltaproteobacteria bacterium]|nr:B12-binding domain-containing radical SAM protein [Deltaproteobacteria bacterium]
MRTAIVIGPTTDDVCSPFPFLGPAILKAFARSRGHSVEIVDLGVRVRHANRWRWRRPFRPEVFSSGSAVRRYLDSGDDSRIAAEVDALIDLGALDDFELVGFSLYDSNAIGAALCLAKRLKQRQGATTVFGGPVIRRGDFEYLLHFDFVDHVVVGDGEEALVALLDGSHGAATPGLVSRGRRANAGWRAVDLPLSSKPLPEFEASDLWAYRRLAIKNRAFAPYLLTRGCRYKCAFCPEYPKVGFEYTPIAKVVGDVRELVARSGIDAIYFTEANITNDLERVRELCDELLAKEVRVPWGGLGTLAGLDRATIRLMADAGCRYLLIGVESGSEAMLEALNVTKIPSPRELRAIFAQLHECGIRTSAQFIVGLPHETERDYQATVALFRELSPHLTRAIAFGFELVEGSPCALRPEKFGLRPTPTGAGDYRFGHRGLPFDEEGGLTWERKRRSVIGREKRLNRLIDRTVGRRLMLRLCREDLRVGLKLLTRRPYFSYDVHL